MLPSYVLITPARNEAEFIELTIKSVIAQTVRPLKWIIVSDGSTDGTDEIVLQHAAGHPWIELLRMPERNERSFSGKARAFAAGYARIRALELEYESVGNLDADLSVDSEFFGFLLSKLLADPELGVVGTLFKDPIIGVYDLRFVTANHVPGMCQLFRRECYEGIGGYLPVKGGGVDYYALLRARMAGWKTRCFPEKVSIHHRPMGTAEHGGLKVMFRVGVKDYTLGGHPLWEVVRVVYRLAKAPLLVGGLAVAAGYLCALIRRAERPFPPEVIAFHRREQLGRLRTLLRYGPFGNIGRRAHAQ